MAAKFPLLFFYSLSQCISRSTYHEQIKYIEQNEDIIRKDRFANVLLSKDMRQFW